MTKVLENIIEEIKINYRHEVKQKDLEKLIQKSPLVDLDALPTNSKKETTQPTKTDVKPDSLTALYNKHRKLFPVYMILCFAIGFILAYVGMNGAIPFGLGIMLIMIMMLEPQLKKELKKIKDGF